MEIGGWRCHYNKIHDQVYTRTYLEYNGPSEPEQEWDDRNRMYSIYYNVMYSCNHGSQGQAIRQVAYDDMYYLIDKYAAFLGGKGSKRLTKADYYSTTLKDSVPTNQANAEVEDGLIF
ncbi:hypothetical protein LTR56_026541 [Elasticomyces elasticus]|nr:hypothetical protein LTR56_026541 [Elasticomyces elasticus]